MSTPAVEPAGTTAAETSLDRYDMFPHIEDCLNMTLREWLLFHNVMHRHYTRYRGRKVLKPPFDWIVLGDIIQETRPAAIVEIGSFEGGTALWLADLVQSTGLDCTIVSIDLHPRVGRSRDPRIHWVHGDATSDTTIDAVRAIIGDRRGMVIEDSDHKEHVTERLLDLYHDLVAPGCYFLVEDTICEFTGTPPFPGPLGAVKRFVAAHPEFVIDRTRERYILTYNPMGYLLRT